MIWGNTQEPTSILAAVNHFNKLGGAIVHEVGVCPLEGIDSGVDTAGLPLMGASPGRNRHTVAHRFTMAARERRAVRMVGVGKGGAWAGGDGGWMDGARYQG